MLRLSVVYERITFPLTAYFLFANRTFPAEYGLTRRKKWKLARRIYKNWRHVQTGNSYKGHLAMAVKLLEIPASVPGAVVECGAWQGGTTTNLSVLCHVVGRELIVYDSFDGLPDPEVKDRLTKTVRGSYKGALDVVQAHVRTYGEIEGVQFRQGWFRDTLPHHTEPIVLLFIDVDLDSSIHDCVVNLWPHLNHQGYVFLDDYIQLRHCALFFSEKFWWTYFNSKPPGLMGSGTGIGLGQLFIGPWAGRSATAPIHRPMSIAYTRKDMDGFWSYRPDSDAAAAEAENAPIIKARAAQVRAEQAAARSTPTG